MNCILWVFRCCDGRVVKKVWTLGHYVTG